MQEESGGGKRKIYNYKKIPVEDIPAKKLSMSFKRTLRENYTFMTDTLIVKGKLIGFLYQEKVMTYDQKEEIEKEEIKGYQAQKLVDHLLRRPEKDYYSFLEGLDLSEQSHIRTALTGLKQESCSPQQEGGSRGVLVDGSGGRKVDGSGGGDADMAGSDSDDEDDDEEEMDEFEEEDEDDDDPSIDPVVKIAEFKLSDSKRKVTFTCQVGKIVKKKKNWFNVEVADDTSAVDCFVKDKDMYDQFKKGSTLMLRRATWNGRVVFVYRNERVTKTAENFPAVDEVMAEAFGTGNPIPIKETENLELNSWFSVTGKVVKVSDLSMKTLYDGKKILAYRRVKLQDKTGSMDLDVWTNNAKKIKLGEEVTITACKKKVEEEREKFTTTRKSKLKVVKEKILSDVKLDQKYRTGTLQSISLEIFQACTSSNCYNFRLHALESKMRCQACNSDYSKQKPNYAKATITILLPNRRSQHLEVFWPQLKELFELFDKKIDLRDGSRSIESKFLDLVKEKKTVKYIVYVNVQTFKLA